MPVSHKAVKKKMPPGHFPIDIKALKNEIERRKYRQTTLADEIKKTQGHVSKMLNGKRQMSFPILAQICEIINIPVYTYIEEDPLNQKIIAYLPHISKEDRQAILNFFEGKKHLSL